MSKLSNPGHQFHQYYLSYFAFDVVARLRDKSNGKKIPPNMGVLEIRPSAVSKPLECRWMRPQTRAHGQQRRYWPTGKHVGILFIWTHCLKRYCTEFTTSRLRTGSGVTNSQDQSCQPHLGGLVAGSYALWLVDLTELVLCCIASQFE